MEELMYKIQLKTMRKIRAFLNGKLQDFIKENQGAEELHMSDFKYERMLMAGIKFCDTYEDYVKEIHEENTYLRGQIKQLKQDEKKLIRFIKHLED